MDFASLMSAQIAKSKGSGLSASEDSKKYLKRSDVEAKREAAYREEQQALEAARVERLEKKRRLDEEESQRKQERDEKRRKLAEESKRRREEEEAEEERARRKRLGLPELPAGSTNGLGEQEGEDTVDIPEDELLEKLRALEEPATLFGEDHKQRLRRYSRIIQRNASAATVVPLSDGPIPTTLQLVSEADMKVELKVPKDEPGRKYLFRHLASYFTMVLREWELALGRRTDEVKSSSQGRQAYKWMVQARDNMRPLFSKMEKGDIEDGVLEPVVEIVKAAQERRYVDANDGYLRLSIGKAAWPIGVTMVGIHERSAREKLHESDKGAAHIMSDETTRKYLQSIKRCLSFAQTRWPPDDQLQLMG